MKIIRLLILAVAIQLSFASHAQTLMGYWNFNQGVSGTPWTAPILANSGVGNAQITAGTVVWTATDAFAGSTINALNSDIAGASLTIVAGEEFINNGKYIQIELSMSGYSDLVISYASRNTSTGFNNNQWAWSTDGVNFTNFGDPVTLTTSFVLKTINAPANLNNAPTAYLRYTFLGSSSNVGNNRIDNLQLNATLAGNIVAPPSFSPAPGTFYAPQSVSMTSATEGATIYYTTNGDEPTQSSTLYTAPVAVSATTTLKAKAFKDGMDPSGVTTGVYTIVVPTNVTSIGQLRQSPQGAAYKLTSEAILTFKQTFRNQKFIQDATGAILIDDLAGKLTQNYTLYDGITNIVGTLAEHQGMLQFTPVMDAPVASSTGNTLTPAVISMNDFLNNFENYESQLVTIDNVEFTTADGTLQFANGIVYPISDGSLSGNFRTTFFDVNYINSVIPTDPLNLTGILNARTEGNYITARFSSDFDFNVISSDATLSVFTLGGINVLNLGGIVVSNPETDPGAELFVADLTGFQGIVATPNHPAATRTVKVNNVLIDEANLASLPLNNEDVVLVTVTAENNAVKYYKVTIQSENRELAITNPTGGETFNTGDNINIQWTSQNIANITIQSIDVTNNITYTVAQVSAATGSYQVEVANGFFGTFKIRLHDANDPGFFVESGNFTVVDNQPPMVQTLNPAHQATNVATDAMLSMNFDENLVAGSGMITIKKLSDNSTFASFAANSAQVDIDGNEVTLVMPQDFESLTTYYVLIEAGAFKDLANNSWAGFSTSSQWSFTTEEFTVPPIVCNGDFENWTNNKPDCWFGAKTSFTAANVVKYTTSAQSGQNAVQLIEATSSHKRFTSQGVQLSAGQEYTITFWVRGQGEIRTGLFDNRETGFGYADYNAYIIVNSTEWAMHTQSVTAITNHNACEFIFSARNTNAAKDHIQIDNVTIVASGTLPQVATPTFNPAPGFYTEAQTVSIASTTEGAVIFYTLDGSEPSQTSSVYSAPLTISETTTIKAKAYKTGMEASVTAIGAYVIGSATEVATIAELRAGTVGELYTLTGEAVITFMQAFRNQKFIQDATAAILVDDNTGIITTAYQRYDGITGITGTLGVSANMLQLSPIADPGAASSTGNTVTPVEISLADMLANENYEAMLVSVPSIAFTTATGTNTFGNGLVYPITDGTTNGNFRTSFFNVNYIGQIIPTNSAKLTGIVTDRTEGRFITARDLGDLSAFVNTPEFSNQSVLLYPNPTNGELNILLPANLKVKVSVYNLSGQLVMQPVNAENSLNLNLSGLTPGTYMVRMISGTQVLNQKLIISR